MTGMRSEQQIRAALERVRAHRSEVFGKRGYGGRAYIAELDNTERFLRWVLGEPADSHPHGRLLKDR